MLPEQTRTVEVTALLRPGDYLYPSVADVGPFADVYAAGDAKYYKGEGVAIRSLHVEGPLLQNWPPPSTRELLTGVQLKKKSMLGRLVNKLERTESEQQATHQVYGVQLSKEPIDPCD